jgi:endonuclease/exonuclease/phosphatase family metal-dependent hydrolase
VSGASAGSYTVVVTNILGSVTSAPGVLTVNAMGPLSSYGLSVMTYNLHGNGVADWSTNSLQVQAIGRQLMYLNPDIITFNEIPTTNMYQMTNWVKAFLPGYSIATNSGSDGFIRSAIASRYPITRSQKWLDGVSLSAFGYSGNFTRDLFEAQINVTNYSLPLHVFVTHLKATTSTPPDDADKRAAEASAVSNFFTTVFLPGTNGTHPYILCGDMNEDVFRPDTNSYTSGQPIQRMTATATGLRLTTPVNPFTGNDFTESIQGSASALNVRFDYILPCGLMYSNIIASQVFRTDLLNPVPVNLFTNDDRTASDHLPVMMFFSNPYDVAYQISSLKLTNQNAIVTWPSITNRQYRVDISTNLTTWTTIATNLTATAANTSYTNALGAGRRFYRVYRTP